MIQWEEVALEDATHIEVNGEVHELKADGEVEKSLNCGTIDILVGKNNWANISEDIFPFLGIKPLRKVNPKPIEFEATVKHSNMHLLDYLDVPKGIPLGKKFRCVQIMEGEE
jgi:hypothetical protein